jgi:hypothetical protein
MTYRPQRVSVPQPCSRTTVARFGRRKPNQRPKNPRVARRIDCWRSLAIFLYLASCPRRTRPQHCEFPRHVSGSSHCKDTASAAAARREATARALAVEGSASPPRSRTIGGELSARDVVVAVDARDGVVAVADTTQHTSVSPTEPTIAPDRDRTCHAGGFVFCSIDRVRKGKKTWNLLDRTLS